MEVITGAARFSYFSNPFISYLVLWAVRYLFLSFQNSFPQANSYRRYYFLLTEKG